MRPDDSSICSMRHNTNRFSISTIRYVPAILCTLLAIGTAAFGFIDRKFTPIDFVKQADTIAIVNITSGAGDNEWTLVPDEALKSKAPGKAVARLAAGVKEVEKIRAALEESGDAKGLLFSASQGNETRGFLHVGVEWLDLELAQQGAASGPQGAAWQINGLSPQMAGAYSGATDSLINIAHYILADPNATVPVEVGTRWMDRSKAGHVEGDVAGMAVVDLKGDGGRWLFVGASGGDRLFRPNESMDALVDATAEAKLDTKSRAFAWVDWNADGRLDLASWDGSALAIRTVNPAGTFDAPAPVANFKVEGACIGLAPLSIGASGKPALLVSTGEIPFAIEPGGKQTQLPAAAGSTDPLGAPGPCIVADLDNDGFCDVLQPRKKSGLLWKGTASGFAAPVSSAVSGGPKAKWTLGDFNADGHLDVFVGTASDSQLWENDGKAGFRPVLRLAGSVARDNPGEVANCSAMDLNHDGRTDLALCFADNGFVYHFNRGYRCMGEEGELRLEGKPFKDALAAPGVLDCVAADFNAGGASDLAVVHANGDVFCYYNDMFDVPAVSIRTAKGVTGPITVSAWQGDTFPVCIGTHAIAGHSPFTLIALRRPGPCILKFTTPGKAPQALVVPEGNGPAKITLGE